MLDIKYHVKVQNRKGERINRNKCIFPPEKTMEYDIKDRTFKEIKACRGLEIKEVIYICPICQREFTKRHGLITHITMAHPEEKYKLKGKK